MIIIWADDDTGVGPCIFNQFPPKGRTIPILKESYILEFIKGRWSQ